MKRLSATILFFISLIPASLAAQKTLAPGTGEVVIAPGWMEGDFLLSASVRQALSPCLDLGGEAIAVPARGSRSELFVTSEVRYGLWYCCIPEYYLNFLYLSAGAGSVSQFGLGARENAFALTYGSGLRIDLFGVFLIGMELKAFSVFEEDGRSERVAFLVGGGLPL